MAGTRHCHRWAGLFVWYGRIHVYRREWSHSCCDAGNCHSLFLSAGVFIISFGSGTRESLLLFLVGFIVIVKGLYASVDCDFDNIWAFNVCFLQLADCCLSFTVIRKLFVPFFKTNTRHNRFYHVTNSTVFAHWLSFEPEVAIQSSVSFDTEVERTRPSHVLWSSLAVWREQPDTFLLQHRTYVAENVCSVPCSPLCLAFLGPSVNFTNSMPSSFLQSWKSSIFIAWCSWRPRWRKNCVKNHHIEGISTSGVLEPNLSASLDQHPFFFFS